jgi:GNAT superfamily N-acetyltransferase
VLPVVPHGREAPSTDGIGELVTALADHLDAGENAAAVLDASRDATGAAKWRVASARPPGSGRPLLEVSVDSAGAAIWIGMIEVPALFRGRGIGTAIVRGVERLARRLRLRSVRILPLVGTEGSGGGSAIRMTKPRRGCS